MQIILFNRDDSSHPGYISQRLHPMDVVAILPDGTDPGSDVVDSSDFIIIDCACTMSDVEHLIEPRYIPASNGDIDRQRAVSLSGMPQPYLNTLIAGRRATIPLNSLLNGRVYK